MTDKTNPTEPDQRKSDSSYADLEYQIKLKTEQLQRANQKLQQEILSRKRAEQATKKIEQERKVLREKLQQSQRLEALGKLAGGVAHDFNNLLMGIQGRTSLMLLYLDESHPHHSHLTGIEEFVKSASVLTNRLLAFARGGKSELRSTDLNELIDKCIQVFGRTKKEITISTRYRPDLKPVEVDANQMEQVMFNLLVNASQAMPAGGSIYIETEIVVLDQIEAQSYEIRAGEYIRIKIADTGKGIDKETLKKIFDPFFTTKNFSHGTGLGLSMVYGIIENHNGAIYVQSEPNSGAVFTIYLPVTNKNVSRKAAVNSDVQHGNETILLIDDEPLIIDVGRDILEALGYSVLTATSGRDAIDMYRRHADAIALVVLDMIMPEMGGSALFDRLKAINPGIKTLLCSGYSMDGQAIEIMERGCNGFVQKPFDIQQLSAKIREILGAKG